MEIDIEEMAEELTRTKRLLNALIDLLEARNIIQSGDVLTTIENYNNSPSIVSQRVATLKEVLAT